MRCQRTLKRHPAFGATVVSLLIWPSSLPAQEDPGTPGYAQLVQEYFITSSVYPQEKGEVQLTTHPSFSSGEVTEAAIPVGIEFGLTDRWQVEVEWIPYVGVKPDGGPRVRSAGDLEIETQYSFMAIRGSRFHAAIGLGATLPTGNLDKGTTEGFLEIEPSLALARDFGTAIQAQLFGAVGLGLVQRRKEPEDPAEREPAAHELEINAGFLAAFGPARLVGELNWTTNEWNHGGEESELYLTPGLIWDLPGTWEVGLGSPLGLTGDSDDFRLLFLLLFEFEIGD